MHVEVRMAPARSLIPAMVALLPPATVQLLRRAGRRRRGRGRRCTWWGLGARPAAGPAGHGPGPCRGRRRAAHLRGVGVGAGGPRLGAVAVRHGEAGGGRADAGRRHGSPGDVRPAGGAADRATGDAAGRPGPARLHRQRHGGAPGPGDVRGDRGPAGRRRGPGAARPAAAARRQLRRRRDAHPAGRPLRAPSGLPHGRAHGGTCSPRCAISLDHQRRPGPPRDRAHLPGGAA